MKDKFVRDTIFGKHTIGDKRPLDHRISNLTLPGVDGEPTRSISYRSDDGLIFYLVKRIERLELQLKLKK
jgi:hypothetical protein